MDRQDVLDELLRLLAGHSPLFAASPTQFGNILLARSDSEGVTKFLLTVTPIERN